MLDQLRQMAIFAKTIDHGSFRGAAEELKISPSVVSHHISQLEDHLGVTLIYRSTRKLTLTRDGERLLAATRNMLGAVEDELVDISGSARDPSGELRVTLPSVLSQSILTDALAEFMRTYPRIRLVVEYSDSWKELIDDGFDVALRMSLKAKEGLTTRGIFEVERCMISSVDYLKNRADITTPQDTLDWDWLFLSKVHSRGIRFHHQQEPMQKIKPKPRFISNDALALLQLASKGAGVAVVPKLLSAEDLKSKNLKYVLPEWKLDKLHVYAEWPSNAVKHGLIFLFVNSLSTFDYGN